MQPRNFSERTLRCLQRRFLGVETREHEGIFGQRGERLTYCFEPKAVPCGFCDYMRDNDYEFDDPISDKLFKEHLSQAHGFEA